MRWPSPKQRLLLQALLGTDQQFKRIWKVWKKRVGPYPELDSSILDIFPYLSKRLKENYPTDSWLTVTKNSYRYHWLHNKLLQSTAINSIKFLQKKGITPLVIKGAAWIPLYYSGDLGLRKLEDIDLYVGRADFMQSLEILLSHGWEIASLAERAYLNPTFAHAVSLVKNNFHLDLHAHLFFANYRGDDSALIAPDFLQKYRSDNFEFTTLCNSDHLVHACANAIERGQTTSLRWVIDIIKIIEHDNLDWDRVIYLTQKKQVSYQVYGVLKYLIKYFNLNIDQAILDKISSFKPSLSSRRLLSLNLRTKKVTLYSTLEYYFWIYYQSIEKRCNPFEWIIKGLMYLKYRLNVERAGQIPFALIQKITSWSRKTLLDPVFS